MYDYRGAIRTDILEYIRENITLEDFTPSELAEHLIEVLWIEDSVTGNASGSYTFSSWQAEEFLMHNLDLLAEAVEELGGNTDILKDGAEACDVTIRCYLLPECVYKVVDSLDWEW